MRRPYAFQEPLIQRLFFLFLALGLLPTILLAAAPTVYVVLHGTDSLGESLLLMWAAQGVSFLIIVLIGASITLRRLAIPIQELANGADAIARGDLSYRVPVRSGEQELILLSQAFNKMADAIETMRDDIDQQHSALKVALDEREREFEAFLKITDLVNNQNDLHNTAEQALNIIREVLGTDTVSLVLFDEAGQVASTVSACKECPFDFPACREKCERQQLLRQCFQAMHSNVFQEAMRRRERISIDDAHSPDAGLENEVIEVLNCVGVRKLAIRPVLTRGRVLGMLVLMRPEPKVIPARASSLVKALSEHIAILIEHWHLQHKSRTLTILEERRRLASELHDSVTQSLFTLSLTARGLKASLAGIPGIDLQHLDVLVEQAKVAQTEMRTLINELRPIDLDANNLEDALQQHAQSLRRSTGIEVKLTLRGDVRSLPQPIQQNLNRIAQEALSNVARHAKAKSAEISLDVGDQIVTLMVQDNGVGFEPRAIALNETGSLGLVSMRERAELLGGALLIRSEPGDLTSITARIPLAPERVSV